MRHSFLAVLALAAVSRAQTGQEYLRLRHLYKISTPVSQRVLDDLVGAKICELNGTVKGTYKIGASPMIQLERPDGTSMAVEADAIPDWMQGNEVRVRLIVRAQREMDGGPLICHVLASGTEAIAASDEPPPAPAHSAKPVPDKKGSRLSGYIPQSRGTGSREYFLTENEATPVYAAEIHRQNPRLSAAEAYRIAKGILTFSTYYHQDARLIMAIISVESDFNPNSTSKHGAQGLAQLMPGTASWMGVHNAYDSIENIYGCVKLINTHITQYYKQTGRDWDALILALAAYNAGEGAVKRHGGIPPYRETQAYIRLVLKKYLAYRGRA
jgi:hypothetical protein